MVRACRAVAAAIFLSSAAGAAVTIAISSPVPRQVIQREDYRPADDYPGRPGGRDAGSARISIRGHTRLREAAKLEARTLLLADAFGQERPWTLLDTQFQGDAFTAGLLVPAGGWYRLEIRAWVAGALVASGSVEPFGVGELFVVAGQSYAANHNESVRRVEDSRGRVVALDWEQESWATADDPQPNSSGKLGTIWPDAMNRLLAVIRVPIGFANAAVSATSSREWMPGETVEKEGRQWTLFENLVRAGAALGPFRAVLWQQGESDVIEATSGDVYESRLREIARQASARWAYSPPWLLAKSTHHPEVYRKPELEAQIRGAIEHLIGTGPFQRGPDTDILGGERYRAPKTRGQHFSTEGQNVAGLLWFSAIWQELQQDTDRVRTQEKP